MSFIKENLSVIAQETKNLSAAKASCNGVTFLGGDGDDTVVACGNQNVIDTQAGDDKIIVVGNQNIVADSKDDSNIAIAGDCNSVVLGDGQDTVKVLGDNTCVYKEEGKLLLGAVGDGTCVASTAEQNIIGAYGDNCEFNLGDNSFNDVRSLDYWLEDGSDGKMVTADDGSKIALKDVIEIEDEDGTIKTLNEYDNSTAERKADYEFFKNNFSDIYNQLTYTSTETSDPVTLSDELLGMNKDEIADKYDLSESERRILESVDLNEKRDDGNSVYTIAFSPKRKEYVVVKRDGATHSRAVADNECIAFNVTDVEEYIEDHKKTVSTTTTDTYTNYGVSNWTINIGKGKINTAISATEGDVNINGGETDNIDTHNINVTGGHISTIETENIDTYYYQKVGFVLGATAGDTWNSPLVLDMNGDGVVSASANIGVDINNDGKADGAATNGDKMLAMSDINGSGTIDGNEVFGDQTVSPFTGKALCADNAFEALKMLAEQAEEYTNIDCFNGSQVDVQKLAEALATVGVKLGFISDSNVQEVEDLYNVKYIDVENYKEVDETGKVQHRQQGSFETEDGETRKADDVWFAV